MDVIEETVKLSNIASALRADNRAVKHVYLVPDRQELDFTLENGYFKTMVPIVDGYAMVVFEE